MLQEMYRADGSQEEVVEIAKFVSEHYIEVLFGYVIDMRCQGISCVAALR